jgi:hypothetical protein
MRRATRWTAAAIVAGAFLVTAPAGPASPTGELPKTCRGVATARACAVALRYLAALDRDRGREACRLLAQSTLAAAGGLSGCLRTLATARGIRIHYALLTAGRSPLGTVVFFTTRGASAAPIPQVMIVTPGGRILLVMPAPG